MASNERNRVLSITMKIVDSMSPVLKVVQGVLHRFKSFAVGAVKAITLPFRLLGSTIRGLLSPIGLVRSAIAFLVARGFFRLFTATAEMGDQLAKLSQRLGITVRDLSILKHAGELADVELEGLAKAFKTLANNADDARFRKGEAIQFLDAAGISVVDAAGKMRPMIDIFGDVADVFSKMEDGAYKAAKANDVFGKAGLDIIPLLNEGREGIRKYADDAERLGLIFTDLEAQQSEQMMDSLTRLKGAWIGIRNAVALQVIPTLTEVFNNTADWIASNRTTLRRWSAETIATINLFARSASALGAMIRDMAVDPESARALGETFASVGLFAMNAMKEGVIAGFHAIGNIIQIMSRPILKAVTLLGQEIGNQIRNGILSPFSADNIILANLEEQFNRASRLVRERGRELVDRGFDPWMDELFLDLYSQVAKFENQIREVQARIDAKTDEPIASIKQRIGEGFQAVVAGIRTDTGDIANALRDGRESIGRELDAMLNRIDTAGVRMIFHGWNVKGHPFIEFARDPHVDAFVAKIAGLREQYQAAMNAAAGLAAVATPDSISPKGSEDDSELMFSEDALQNIQRRQSQFLAMMQTGRRRAMLEEQADYEEQTRVLWNELQTRQIDYETYLMGLEALRAEHERRMMEFNGSFMDGARDAFQAWAEHATNAFQQGREAATKIIGSIESGFSDVFDSMINGTKSMKDAWKDFGREVLSIIGQIIAKQVALSAVSFLFPGFGMAKGGAIWNGRVQKFAKGGVVNRPTFFQTKDGPGVAGENFTNEGIFPLARDRRTGELGVKAVGGSGGSSEKYEVNVSFNLPNVVDRSGFDRSLIESSATIEAIVTRAIHTSRQMKNAVKAA